MRANRKQARIKNTPVPRVWRKAGAVVSSRVAAVLTHRAARDAAPLCSVSDRAEGLSLSSPPRRSTRGGVVFLCGSGRRERAATGVHHSPGAVFSDGTRVVSSADVVASWREEDHSSPVGEAGEPELIKGGQGRDASSLVWSAYVFVIAIAVLGAALMAGGGA